MQCVPPVKKKARVRVGGAKSSLRVGGVKGEERSKGKKRLEKEEEEEKPRAHVTQGQPRTLPTSFKIVAGSYEKLLYGLHGTVSPSPSTPYTLALTPIFIFPAHVSCIKAVAASPAGGKWLATGSTDEIIKVWDLRRRKEVGGLMHHEGSITHLEFPSRSHLLSASEDGTLCLFRARDWSVLRALRGHRGRVNSVAVHPSSKVALSVGRDRALRMWDLMRGKGCASTKLPKEAELVRWSTDGTLFAVQTGCTIDIYTTSMERLHTLTHPARLHDVRFCRRVGSHNHNGEDKGETELLLAAAEDKLVTIYTLSPNTHIPPYPIAVLTGHLNRVKAISTLDIALPTTATASPHDKTTIACTVSSDGLVHVYDLAMLPVPSDSDSDGGGREVVRIAPVAVYDTKGTRLTCLTLADGDPVGAGAGGSSEAQAGEKRKEREGEECDESEAEEEAEEWPSEQEEEEESE